jgi:serine/threonine-protein kinase
MLWELLSGRRFTLVPSRDADDSAPAHADSTTRRDSEVDPQQATQIAAARQSSVPALARALRGDLERIVRRCLSPQPERRYAGAAQLADDLRRYLRGDPVSATDDSWAYRLGKFVRRQRLAVGAVVSVVLALAIGLGLALHEARALRRAEARIETALGLLEGVFLGADPYSAKGGDTRATDLLASAHARVSSELGDEPALAARLLGRIGAVYVSLDDRRNAEATLREAVQAGTRAGLAARIDTAAARARLAHYALVQDGDATKLAELESAIAELRAAGPAGRPSLAQALSFKSDHLFNTGQYETIPALAAECVVLARESNGPLAADYIMALGNQASLLRAIGRENDAVAPAREAWQQVQALGKEAPAAVALYAEGQYAGALAATGDAASAAPLLRDALAQAEKINGADSSFAIGLLWELSSAQATLGQNELAAAGFSRLLGYMGDVRTANRIAVQNALGSALLALGRAAEAAPQFADAETIACASTADSPSCVAIRLNVAEAQLALQHTQEAGRMLDAIAPLIAADNERARARWQKLDARRQGH